MKDERGLAHMTQGNLTYFTTDRFNNTNSALALNGGWTQVPSGIYFDTPEFTISVWVLPRQIGYAARVIDFGNSSASSSANASNNIVLRLDTSNDYRPALNIHNDGNSIGDCVSLQPLSNNFIWQLLTATFNGTLMSIYINGNLTKNTTVNFILSNTTRNYNFIGKPYDSLYNYSWSYLDDLRFYNKCLTQSEIIELMIQNKTNTCASIIFILFFEILFLYIQMNRFLIKYIYFRNKPYNYYVTYFNSN